ncbi:hypothetical protein OKW33_003366 [Paraburkholderia atlantica]|uniref:hypothetical protein n=1 Tax=Paraburkholderia atlantica TaxID=2654982 RepID=UPI00128E7C51|nr:hypothetical protein [Paraburkholderia atlantica]MPW10107.1 hypothetical protein [Paraburkholderia atlantica]
MNTIAMLVPKIPDVGFVVSVVAAIAALLASGVTSWISFRRKAPALADPNANLEEQTRTDEVKEALKRNESMARWAGGTNALLVFATVVIGGVLATSLVQQAMDHSMLSLLGVIVLLSSLMHQQFRPDLRHRGARRRVAALTVLLSEAEDGVFEIRRGVAEAPSVEALRRYVSRRLAEFNTSEVEELPGERRIERTQMERPAVLPLPSPPTGADATAESGSSEDASVVPLQKARE